MEKNEDELTFNYEFTPKFWENCFNHACPKANACLRHLAGMNIPDGMTHGPAIYPDSYKNENCEHFIQIRVINGAYGFDKMLNQLKRKDEIELRARIQGYLGGGGTYYHYNHGRKLLTPEQQKRIIEMYHDYEYSKECQFEGYKKIYDFN